MKTFQEFISICEASDADKARELGWGGGAQIKKTGEGGRIGRERKKTTPEKRRVRAVGGGKTEPVEYKPRKDIGQQRQTSTRVQQPTQERGSVDVKARAAAAAKEERKKAALARIAARKSGQKATTEKPKGREAEKTATKLLSTKKKEEKPAPGYTPPKASGYSTKERKALYKKGERVLRDIVLQATGKKSEKELKHKFTSK